MHGLSVRRRIRVSARARLTPVRARLAPVGDRVLMTAGAIGLRLDATTETVALTFDDGPDPLYTMQLLKVLDRLDIQATFFLVGRQALMHPRLARALLASGHAVGSHSFSHPDPWSLSLGRLASEYRRGRRAVEEACGQEISLFRPPKGHISASGIVAMRAAAVRPWLWSVDSKDWEPGISRHDIELELHRVRGGDVVLLHDAIQGPLAPSALDRTATIDALPGVVGALRAAGLGFATLT